MPNKIYAQEWIVFSLKNLKTAQLLYEANHYEDIIGIELQQALEKMLKSLLAYKNSKIPKSHKLLELVVQTNEINFMEDELILLETATNYYRVDRYPNPNYSLPTRDEIAEVLNFTEMLFGKVCKILRINEEEIM
jgi:HEPN domain-containing protein